MNKLSQEEWEASIQRIGIVAGCIIFRDGKYLMVQERQEKVYGLWNVPAGYVDNGEEAETAAIREALEESGYEVVLEGLIGLYHDTTFEPLKHVYEARVVGGDLRIQEDEILDAKWLTFTEIKNLNKDKKLRARWIFDAICRAEEKRT
ncbi:NUDIX domain-containing protein [bacterium]|nr:MAG: NUDIX domain-containing protein [bacterium]